ncbi:MAG: lipocalin family protein [Bacteroidales bacterium]|nr:lipocalin family protein [Bacteroidales bacterium]
MKRLTTIILAAMIAPFCLFAQKDKLNNIPIKSLDLNRYLGTWYEIARFDHSFERGMDFTQAHYSLNPNGTIRVLNSGLKDGKFKSSTGKAFVPNIIEQPALLRVSFFGPFYSDYRVLMLTSDYKYALVGSGSDKYLWILSRSPKVTKDIMTTILDEARRRGYDTSKLIWVDHSDPMTN